MSEEPKWGWMEVGTEEAYGEFASKEEALEAAKKHFVDQGCAGEIEIEVGRCDYPNPADYVNDDLGCMLEHMDEHAVDGDYGFWEAEIFEAKDEQRAKEALTKALREWANEHIVEPSCWVLAATEKVKVIL